MHQLIKIRLFAVIIVSFIACGCASTYRQETLVSPRAKLSRNKSVLISTPADGFYESDHYADSGKATSNAVRAAFAYFSNNVAVVPDCENLVCLQKGRPQGTGYYVVPEILHWEERATEWSGLPDKIEIKISVYEGRNLEELASTVVSGKSKWATFGGDHPQDLLPEPIKKFVRSLY